MREKLSKTAQTFVSEPGAWIHPKQSRFNIALYKGFLTQLSCFPGIWVNYGENVPLHVVPLYAAVFRNISAVSKDFHYCLQCFCKNTETLTTVTYQGLLHHRLRADLLMPLIVCKNGTHVSYVIFVLSRPRAAGQRVVTTLFEVFVET